MVGNAVDGNSWNRLDIADKITKVVGVTGGCSTIDDNFKMLARRRVEGLIFRKGSSGKEPFEYLASGKKGIESDEEGSGVDTGACSLFLIFFSVTDKALIHSFEAGGSLVDIEWMIFQASTGSMLDSAIWLCVSVDLIFLLWLWWRVILFIALVVVMRWVPFMDFAESNCLTVVDDVGMGFILFWIAP